MTDVSQTSMSDHAEAYVDRVRVGIETDPKMQGPRDPELRRLDACLGDARRTLSSDRPTVLASPDARMSHPVLVRSS